MKTELDKALRAYEKAAHKLITLRDQIYPMGTKGICKPGDYKAAVKSGSYYPDQLLTNWGHISFRNFEKLKSNIPK